MALTVSIDCWIRAIRGSGSGCRRLGVADRQWHELLPERRGPERGILGEQPVQDGGAAAGQADDDDRPLDGQVQDLRAPPPEVLEAKPGGEQTGQLPLDMGPAERVELQLFLERAAEDGERLVQRRGAEVIEPRPRARRGLQRLRIEGARIGCGLCRRQRCAPGRRVLRPCEGARAGGHGLGRREGTDFSMPVVSVIGRVAEPGGCKSIGRAGPSPTR